MTHTTIAAAEADAARDARVDARWAALRTLWQESGLPRVRNCRRVASDAEAGVVVRRSPDGHAGLGGVQTCGSTWACPCCSAKIAAHRAGEIASVISGWNRAHPDGGAVLVTATVRHSARHRLAKTWDAVSFGWGRVTSGRAWKRDKADFGIGGYIRVVEVTHSFDNGWHVHVHAVLLTDRLLTEYERESLSDSMWERWRSGLASHGYTAERRVGLDVRPIVGEGALGDYFTKATYELTGAAHKGHRKGHVTPFGLLEEVVATGCADSLDAWREWERASKGRRQLTWSQGLRGTYLSEPELTDEEAAALAEDGETVAHLEAGAYKALARDGLVPMVLRLARDDVAELWLLLGALLPAGSWSVPDAGRTRSPGAPPGLVTTG